MIANGRVVTGRGILEFASLLSLLVGGVMAADPPPSNQPYVRRQAHYLPLPGSAIGVLVGSARGVTLAEGRAGSPDALAFSSGGGSYRWVYVPVEGKASIGTLMIPVGESPGKLQAFDKLSLATPETVKRFGVVGPYALVRVEVNGGLGSPATDRFVATKIEPLDGTPRYPIKVADVVHHFHAVVDKLIKTGDTRKQITDAMDQSAKLAGQERVPETRRELITPYVTWDPDKEQLRAEYRIEIAEGVLEPGRGTVPQGPRARPPVSAGSLHGKVFGVELELVFIIDRAGKEVRRQMHGPTPFARDLPPPQRQYAPGAGPLRPR